MPEKIKLVSANGTEREIEVFYESDNLIDVIQEAEKREFITADLQQISYWACDAALILAGLSPKMIISYLDERFIKYVITNTFGVNLPFKDTIERRTERDYWAKGRYFRSEKEARLCGDGFCSSMKKVDRIHSSMDFKEILNEAEKIGYKFGGLIQLIDCGGAGTLKLIGSPQATIISEFLNMGEDIGYAIVHCPLDKTRN